MPWKAYHLAADVNCTTQPFAHNMVAGVNCERLILTRLNAQNRKISWLIQISWTWKQADRQTDRDRYADTNTPTPIQTLTRFGGSWNSSAISEGNGRTWDPCGCAVDGPSLNPYQGRRPMRPTTMSCTSPQGCQHRICSLLLPMWFGRGFAKLMGVSI